MLCIVWVPAIFGGPSGSRHLDLMVEFRLYLNMDKLQPLSALLLTGNLLENGRHFEQQFQIYKAASGLAGKDGKV